MSITRAAHEASFAKLVSLVAYRDSRRAENQRILRDQFHWLARLFFVLNSVPASFGVLLERLGTVWRSLLERVVSLCSSLECFSERFNTALLRSGGV